MLSPAKVYQIPNPITGIKIESRRRNCIQIARRGSVDAIKFIVTIITEFLSKIYF